MLIYYYKNREIYLIYCCRKDNVSFFIVLFNYLVAVSCNHISWHVSMSVYTTFSPRTRRFYNQSDGALVIRRNSHFRNQCTLKIFYKALFFGYSNLFSMSANHLYNCVTCDRHKVMLGWPVFTYTTVNNISTLFHHKWKQKVLFFKWYNVNDINMCC